MSTRKRPILNPITAKEITKRLDAARGPVDPPRPEPPRPEAVRAEERERVLLAIPVERQSPAIRLDLLERTNTPQQYNAVIWTVQELQRRARENPRHFGMSVADAAAELGVSSRLVERWIEAGTLRAEKLIGIGQRLFILPEDVAKLKAEREARKSAKKGNDSP